MKRIILTLILFASLFTSNLYSNTSEIPNEKVFDNPKKEVTTVEAKKNKEHAEMNIAVNKLSIQEIQGHDIGNGKTQYFIPKEEKENKLLRSLINNTDNQYLIFETKEQLSEYLNKNKKARNKRNLTNSIQYEVMQDEEQTMLTVNSDKDIYILDNKNNVYFGTPLNIETRATDFAAQVKFILDRAFLNYYFKSSQKIYLSQLAQYPEAFCFANGEVEYGPNRDEYLSNGYSYNYIAIKKGSAQPLRYTLGKSKNLVTEEVWDGLEYVSGNISPLNEISVVLNKKQDWKTVGRKDVLDRSKVNFYEIARAGFYDITTALYMRPSGSSGSVKSGHKLEFTVRDQKEIDFWGRPGMVDIQIFNAPLNQYISTYDESLRGYNIDATPSGGRAYDGYRNANLKEYYIPIGAVENMADRLASLPSITIFSKEENLIQIMKGNRGLYYPKIKLLENPADNRSRIIDLYIKFPWKSYILTRYRIFFNKTKFNLNMSKAIPNIPYIIQVNSGIVNNEYRGRDKDPIIHEFMLDGSFRLKTQLRLDRFENGNKTIDTKYYTASITTFNEIEIRPKPNNNNERIPPLKVFFELSTFTQGESFGSSKDRYIEINIEGMPSIGETYSFSSEIDQRFKRAVGSNRTTFLGRINGQDYSKLFKNLSPNSMTTINAVAAIDNNYSSVSTNGIQVTDVVDTDRINMTIYKNKTPLEATISLINYNQPNLTKTIKYLGDDNKYHDVTINLTSNPTVPENKIYSGTGNIDLSTAKKDKLYIFTKTNLSNNEGLTLNNNGEFITTGTAFNANSDIVNRITVNSGEIIHGKTYKDSDVEITLGENSLSIKKLKDFISEKTLTIKYYYNDLLLGTYSLTLKSENRIILSGIDNINFGTLIPGQTSSLEGKFTIENITSNNITLQVPTNSQMTQKGEPSSTIPLKIESTKQPDGNNIKGWLRVSATPPKGTTPGEYEGIINLTVTIE